MQKVEKDGMVAVLYSADYGCCWSCQASTHEEQEALCMNAEIVQHFLDGDVSKLVMEVAKAHPHISTVNVKNLAIKWVPKGCAFEIDEYDGAESVVLRGSKKFMRA